MDCQSGKSRLRPMGGSFILRRADDCHDDYQRPTPTPAAEVIAVHNYGGGLRTIRCMCPYCGRTELHPWPATNPEPGTYTAECGRGDYTIQTPTTKGTPK